MTKLIYDKFGIKIYSKDGKLEVFIDRVKIDCVIDGIIDKTVLNEHINKLNERKEK